MPVNPARLPETTPAIDRRLRLQDLQGSKVDRDIPNHLGAAALVRRILDFDDLPVEGAPLPAHSTEPGVAVMRVNADVHLLTPRAKESMPAGQAQSPPRIDRRTLSDRLCDLGKEQAATVLERLQPAVPEMPKFAEGSAAQPALQTPRARKQLQSPPPLCRRKASDGPMEGFELPTSLVPEMPKFSVSAVAA
jgi:hypothetical protein